MKVIRCKDCAFANTLDCPMNYIDHRRMIITNRSPLFFCADAQPTEEYTPTNGDNIRNMSDAELAEFLCTTEAAGFDRKKFVIATVKAAYRAYVGTPEDEDVKIEVNTDAEE